MGWPNPGDYAEAIQNPRIVFDDPELKECTIECDTNGFPKARSGTFAIVFKANRGSKSWAIRCFTHDIPEQERRYRAISAELERHNLPFMVKFRYLPKGILVTSQWYPILKMEWIQGELLHTYLETRLQRADLLTYQANKLTEIVTRLSNLGIAHGDLQHGNIMVQNNSPVLIDYDGMFVPALRGQQSVEYGHSNFQHPNRNSTHFSSSLDTFSLWVIVLSLKALAADSTLWRKYKGGDDCLLFRKSDFLHPDQSDLFRELASSPDSSVQSLVQHFRSQLRSDPLQLALPNRMELFRFNTQKSRQPVESSQSAVGDWLTLPNSDNDATQPISSRFQSVYLPVLSPPLPEPDIEMTELSFVNHDRIEQTILIAYSFLGTALAAASIFHFIPWWFVVVSIGFLGVVFVFILVGRYHRGFAEAMHEADSTCNELHRYLHELHADLSRVKQIIDSSHEEKAMQLELCLGICNSNLEKLLKILQTQSVNLQFNNLSNEIKTLQVALAALENEYGVAEIQKRYNQDLKRFHHYKRMYDRLIDQRKSPKSHLTFWQYLLHL